MYTCFRLQCDDTFPLKVEFRAHRTVDPVSANKCVLLLLRCEAALTRVVTTPNFSHPALPAVMTPPGGTLCLAHTLTLHEYY